MMLMPAGVLIMVILASLALDRALVFAEQRDLVSTAQAAANDAAAFGVDPARLRVARAHLGLPGEPASLVCRASFARRRLLSPRIPMQHATDPEQALWALDPFLAVRPGDPLFVDLEAQFAAKG